MNEKPIFITSETKEKLHPVDEQVRNPDPSTLIELTPEKLQELAAAAEQTVTLFQEMAQQLVDRPKAEVIRRWRVDEGYSWRSVAQAAFDAWALECCNRQGQAWSPPSNQLFGMALCEVAAEFFNEEFMSPPWN